MVFYDSEGREFSIDLSRGVSHNELEHLRKMCDQYRFELICKDVLLSKSNEMLESALKEIRVTLGCNACIFFKYFCKVVNIKHTAILGYCLYLCVAGF